MGRGGDYSADKPGVRRTSVRKPESLSVGRDMNGQEVRLGEEDSTGTTVGFISSDGSCWISVAEHDEIKTLGAFEKEMLSWQRGERAAGQPEALEIAENTCLDPNNKEAAAAAAKENWEAIAARERRLIEDRGDDFRSLVHDLSNERYPLSADGRHFLYPSRIAGAQIHVARITETEEEREAAIDRILEINNRMAEEGFESLNEELLEAIINEDERLFSLLRGEEREEDNREEFAAIVEDLEPGEPVWIWGTSIDIPFGPLGDGLAVELKREGQDDAFAAALELEKRLIRGHLSEEEVELRVITAPYDPEREKSQALDVLAGGRDHPALRRARALGLNEERILEEAEEIALGGGEKPLFAATAQVFLPDLGQVEITVSGETSAEVARRARTVLPGALYPEEIS